MWLVNQHPVEAGEILLDDAGQLGTMIQIIINNEGVIPHNEIPQRRLKEGDTVKFMLLFGGG